MVEALSKAALLEYRNPARSLPSSRHLVAVCGLFLAGAAIAGLPIFLSQGQASFIWHFLPVNSLQTSTPRRLELPWPPLLTPEEQRRGISYYGSGGALDRVARKLLAGQPIKAYALGGSVTTGGGASVNNQTAYVPRFFRFIQANFPHSGHVLENKGIAASTAFMYATCLQHHVPEDADLVTLEFTVNERQDAPYPTWERRSYEQLIRRLLLRATPPAIIIIHHYGWWNSGGDGVDRGLFYQEPELQLTAFSHFYDVPAVSVRAAAWRLMHAGIDHFKVHQVTMAQRPHMFLQRDGTYKLGNIPMAPKAKKELFFFADHAHPYDPGHQVLAELLAAALSRAVWEASSGEGLAQADQRQDARLQQLPPPMIPLSVDDIPGICAMLEEFKPIVKSQRGFQYQPERPEAEGFVKQKWGWTATEPGAWAELEVDTRASDGSPAADTVVWLSHLQSYEGMGTARISCMSGCSCNDTRLDGTWARRASLFTITRFHVTRHKQCRFRVTVLEEPGQVPQEGHKVVLVAVMVTHVPLDFTGGKGSLGAVNNIGLTTDKGF